MNPSIDPTSRSPWARRLLLIAAAYLASGLNSGGDLGAQAEATTPGSTPRSVAVASQPEADRVPDRAGLEVEALATAHTGPPPVQAYRSIGSALKGQIGSGRDDLSGSRPEIPSVDALVSRAAVNWGGMARLRSIRTLRARFTYNEADGPVTHDVQRPSQLRSTGGDRYASVFDGKRAAFLRRLDKEGNVSGPTLVEEDEAKDWELERAWVFPAFFDYPSEYRGYRSVNGARAHILRVMLPLGAQVDYFVDAQSFLVVRIEGLATIGGIQYRSGRTYSDFEETDGVLYPTDMTYFYGGEPETGTIGGLEVNPEFPADHFLIPETVR